MSGLLMLRQRLATRVFCLVVLVLSLVGMWHEKEVRDSWKAQALQNEIDALRKNSGESAKPGNNANNEIIESLIAKLHSTNKDPNPDMRPFVIRLPSDYNTHAQDQVEDARKQLIELGKDAFPTLIAHVNDEGYSRSIETAVLRGQSVGEVCFDIIEDQVDLAGMSYKSRLGSDGQEHGYMGYLDQFFSDGGNRQKALNDWWNQHHDQSLKQMQIEALKWAIEREQKIGFSGA